MLVLKTNWPSSVTVTLFTFSITHFGIAPRVANSKVLGKGMWTTYSRLLCCSAQQRFKLMNSRLPFQHISSFSQDRINSRPMDSLTITVWPWGDHQLNQPEITTGNYLYSAWLPPVYETFKCQGSYMGKTCHRKQFIVNFTSGATPLLSRLSL